MGVAGRAPDAAVDAVGRGRARCAGAPGERSRPRRRDRDGRNARPCDRLGRPRGRPSIEPGALVFHLAGSCNLDVFDDMLEALPTRIGRRRRAHRVAASVADVPEHERGHRTSLRVVGRGRGRSRDRQHRDHPGAAGVRVAAHDRARYHAAAVVASNHVIALLGQVARLAASADVPFEAFRPLVLTSVENAFALGPGAHSQARSRAATSRPSRRTCKRSTRPSATHTARSAREASKLADRRDDALQRLLDDMRAAE